MTNQKCCQQNQANANNVKQIKINQNTTNLQLDVAALLFQLIPRCQSMTFWLCQAASKAWKP